MIYPKNIQLGDIIATTAPSGGITEDIKILTLDNAINNIKKLGYGYRETQNVRTEFLGRSSSAEQRAKQFTTLWNSDDVSAIIFAAGGDFLVEILDYIDFKEIQRCKPKWLQGFSDITGLNFIITTMLDIATIYGENFKSFGMNKLHQTLLDSFEIMKGKEIIQNSYDKYQIVINKEDPYAEYNLTEKSLWKNLNEAEEQKISGRAIGGCFDVITNIIGTKYDKIVEYINRYKDDGIVWFLEVYEMSAPQVVLNLWKMKNAGYFKNCKGLLFGRPLFVREDYEMTFKDAIKQALEGMKIPVIYDVDIGHVAPQMPILNGGIIEAECKNGRGNIKNIFK